MAGPALRRFPRLLLITDRQVAGNDLEERILQAVAGGVDHLLVREKDLEAREFLSLVKRLSRLLANTPVGLLVSGHVEMALEWNLQGVHLPAWGMSVGQARHLLGTDCLLGRSCHTMKEGVMAFAQGADYVTLSPLFTTQSHPGTPPLGLERFAAMRRDIPGPVLALGGVNVGNAHLAMRAGADGLALIRGILDAEHVREKAFELHKIIDYSSGV